MFRVVGDVAESVSSLKLVEPFPKTDEGTFVVFSESLGLFAGEGDDATNVGPDD